MGQSQTTILRGEVEKVFYAGPKFSAGRLRGTDGKSRLFAGNLFATEGQHIALAGRWETHPDYGRQFKVDHVEIEMPSGAEGLAEYVANHPEVKGIGPARAAKIVQAFGEDFERVLLESPEGIAQAVKVPLPAIGNLRSVWIASRKFNAAMTWLSAFGLTHHQVTMLIGKLGNNALALLQGDPYRLMREIKGLGFRKVDQIARKMGTPKEHQPRIRAGILHCIHEALGEGDCWVELEELVERANLLLIMDCLDSRERIEAELSGLVGEKSLRCVDMGGRVVAALAETLKAEAREKHTRCILDRCLDPTDWDLLCAVTEILADRVRNYLPADLASLSTAQLAPSWRTLLMMWIDVQRIAGPKIRQA